MGPLLIFLFGCWAYNFLGCLAFRKAQMIVLSLSVDYRKFLKQVLIQPYLFLTNMTQFAEINIITNDKIKSADQSSEELRKEEKEEEDQPEMADFTSLFRFATKTDKILIVCGTICAMAMGVALPSFAILWGNMTDNFNDQGEIQNAAKDIMFNFIEIGAAALVAGWGMFACWMIAGERQSIACRKEYLKSLLRQEMGWFDTINQSELATKFATDCFAFQGAIGQKVSTLIMTISMFVAGFIIAFIKGWVMTLVIICSLPFIALGGYLFMSASAKKDKEQESEYSQAGGQVQQAVSAIKTVKQLNGEQYEAQKYAETLKPVTENSSKHGAYLGIGMGTLFLSILASYSLGFWYGSLCVEGASGCSPDLNGGSKYSAGNVLVVFFSVLMGGFNLTQITPAMKKITEGRVAAVRIFKIIDRDPLIKSPQNGIIPQSFHGVFRFQGVTFAYPKDKSKIILNNLNLILNSKFSAFVGESGCGKSTIFQLIMRLYDPDRGRITLDGVNIKDLDLKWLRSQIGYVGQEPVLFAASIKENLLFGKEDATDEEITDALKKAEAYNFIEKFKDKLDTYVGVGGGQMSGGQKQRIAIARALLKNPKILLLDEATSALDRRNQKLIQTTLNKIAQDKITITIAHRIKTIMNCDHIVVMEGGHVGEEGRFRELKRYQHVEMEEEDEPDSPGKGTLKKTETIDQVINVVPAGEEEKKEELTDEEKKKKEEEELLEKYQGATFGRLFGYASDKKLLFFIGFIVSVGNGLIFPAFSIFISKMLDTLLSFENNVSQARTDANLYALIFLLLGIASFILNTIQHTIFTNVGQSVTEKVRNQTYLKILRMPVSWFDKPKNSSGSLSARLASDCHVINGLITTFLGLMIQILTTLISGVVIAFVYEWRTAAVATGLLPIMVISGAIQMAFTQGFSDKTDKAYKESSNLITEATNYIRTVTSFGSQEIIQRKYDQRLVQPMTMGFKKGMVSGFLYGLTQIMMFFIFGLIFYLGIVFMVHNNLAVADVFTAIYAILFAGMTAGNNAHMMPDMAVGKKAAASIFQILDSLDEDQLQKETGSKMVRKPIKGHILVDKITFKYESRDHPVFTDLSLEIKEGQKVGFVGSSGCGKSTIHQLLQRFYDADQGQIYIDGVNIKDYDVHYLRSHIGVVSQEPVLFNDTIGENIKYNRFESTKEEIVAAADQSNFNPERDAIEVVEQDIPLKKSKMSKKEIEEEKMKEEVQKKKLDGTGFNKNVGLKGSHISGGQKQRVAIARVILRQPNLLLLDEATSALDSKNQKKVQQSLDRMMRGKTSITIAHRLETIRNSDQIMVFHIGKIVESGTYDDLMAKKGYFYNLERGLEII